jgi:predicted dehydrogenase
MNSQIRVGVIGVGYMGQHHARVWSTMPQCQLVGVADANPVRVQEIANLYGVRAFADHHDLLEQVDAMSIAAPTVHHYRLGQDCVAHGVHMMIEKPLAASYAEAQQLVAAAELAQVLLQVGHVERFNPTFVELQHVLTGAEILAIDARRLSPTSTRAADVSVVYDLLVHDLDLTLALLGADPSKLHAVGRNILVPQLDYVVALLTFPQGELVTLTASKATQHKVRELTVTCRDAFVVADFLNRTVMIHRQSTGDYVAQRGEVLYRQEGIIEQVYVPPVEPLYAELRHFLSCVQDQRQPLVGGADALRVLALTDQIEASALRHMSV